MRPTVVVTGGSGLLALNWAVVRRSTERVVLCLHRRSVTLAGVQARFVRTDSVDSVDELLRDTRADIVIHTAGMTNVDACEARPDDAYAANVVLAETVAEAARRHGCVLVHISTDHLFGGASGIITETTEPTPTNVYGRTKAEAEQRVLNAHPEAIVVRTNFYGWGPPHRPSFSDTILQSLRGGRTISLFDDVRYTPILVDALIVAVHDLIAAGGSGVFNVSGDDSLTKHDFGQRVARRFSLDATLIDRGSLADQPQLAPRPRNMSLSNRKLAAVLGRDVGGVNAHLDVLFGLESEGRPHELRHV
jgi:dTDP-4-dehydrorhamnose reductase